MENDPLEILFTESSFLEKSVKKAKEWFARLHPQKNFIEVWCGEIHGKGMYHTPAEAFLDACEKTPTSKRQFAPLAMFKINGGAKMYQEPSALLKENPVFRKRNGLLATNSNK